MSIAIGLVSLLLVQRCCARSDAAWSRDDKGEAWLWLGVGIVALAVLWVTLVVLP